MNRFAESVGAGASPKLAGIRFDTCSEVALPKNCDSPMVVLGGGPAVALAAEAYKSLRTRLAGIQAARGIRSVAVTSAAQSDGKTLTSFNLACCCAQLDATQVLLIDADLRTRGLTRLIGRLSQRGLANVLDGSAPFEHAIATTNVPNLCIMGAGSSGTEPAELFSSDTWKEFIEWASDRFKLVLVDSLPVGSVTDYDLIAAACDGTLVVVRAQKTLTEALEQAIERIEPRKLIGVVWNAAQETKSHQIAYANNYTDSQPAAK